METEEIDVLIVEDNEIEWCPQAIKLLKEDKLIVTPAKSKSKNWKHFRMINNPDTICVECGDHLKYDTNSISFESSSQNFSRQRKITETKKKNV